MNLNIFQMMPFRQPELHQSLFASVVVILDTNVLFMLCVILHYIQYIFEFATLRCEVWL